MCAFTIGLSQDDPVEVPKITVRIPLGEIVQFKNATVKFIKVLEDSRCPKDVTCVWAGRARIMVEVTEMGKNPVEMELLFGGRAKNILYASEEYVLKGILLTPYPTTATAGKMEYGLLVSEEKTNYRHNPYHHIWFFHHLMCR